MFYTLSEFPLREREGGKSEAGGRGKKEKMARIVGANYTDEASLKHTYTLITVDRDAIGGDSVERSESE